MVNLTCPNCHQELTLTLIREEKTKRPVGVETTPSNSRAAYRFTIGGRLFELTPDDVIAATDFVRQSVYDSYVEIPDAQGGIREFPTKDLLRQAILRKYPDVNPRTDLQPSNGFQSQRAEHVMRKLHLPPKRKLASNDD